jgi:subtilisin family serine protease
MSNIDAFSFLPPRPHYYLWHLISLGVIEAQFPDFVGEAERDLTSPDITGSAWDRIRAHSAMALAPGRIALIDVGVGRNHPNLKARIDQNLSIDFVSHPYGAKTVQRDDATAFEPEQSSAFFTGLSVADLEPLDLSVQENAFLTSLVSELANSNGVVRTLIDNDDVFGTHGTAIAGLAVGEPQIANGGDVAMMEDILTGGDDLAPGLNINLIPYFGVDPLSELISIRSSFEQKPEHFIAAFLYAWKTGADVILLPRGIPDPARGWLKFKQELSEDLDDRHNWERADLFARLEEMKPSGSELQPHAAGKTANQSLGWDVLASLLIAISKQVPIVCAAGNDGESQLIYPANLAAPDNGIVAVGAVTAASRRAGYSNYGHGLTLVAPSDDSEVHNRHQLRINRTDPLIGQHAYVPRSAAIVPFSEFNLLTTDLPGVFGYSPGEEPYSLMQPPQNKNVQQPQGDQLQQQGSDQGTGGGYYTSFGGTSGASALVGGAAALVARAYKVKHGQTARLSGPALKQILVAACDQNAEVVPGAGPLTADPMNADNEATKGREYFFGAGLLNVGSAVQAILSS